MSTTVITTIPFTTLVQNSIDQWASNLSVPPVLNPGDPLLAIFQASAAQAVFLESLDDTIANYARAQTSTGAALDSWMAQFGFVRLPAIGAFGPVTFSTASVLAYNVVIPVGAIVQTSGGAIQFQVIADTTQAAYNATANAYIILAGNTSCSVTVQCTVVGTVGNVSANTIIQLSSTIPGVASINNASAFTNGVVAESDTAFFTRWVAHLSSLSNATLAAITAAINAIQTGLDFQILDNTTQTNTTQYGFFTVVVENGNQPPSGSLLTTIFNTLNGVRAFTVQDVVVAPTIETLSAIALTVNLSATGTNAGVQAALATFVNGLTIGTALHISDITANALANGAASVQGGSVLINGSSSDFVINDLQVIRIVQSNITVNNY